MLLRNPISGTRKLFRKTIQSVKSLFSGGGYEKLPKDPPQSWIDPAYFGMTLQSNYNDLGNSSTDFSTQWDAGNRDKTGRQNGGKESAMQTKTGDGWNRGKQGNAVKDRGKGKRANWLVAEKLRELEMLDVGNVDHLLDIEEVLHYYSRLTCPAYLDIVDRFFANLYSEFAGLPESSAGSGRPNRPRLQAGRKS